MAAILNFRSEWFYLFWSTSHPDASYQVSRQSALCFKRKSKNRFSRWRPWRPSWISLRTILAICIHKSPRCFLPSKSIGLSVQEKKCKQIFKIAGSHAGHHGFLFETILAIFDLQVTPMLLPGFKSTGPLVLEKKRKIDFMAANLDYRSERV